MQSSAVSDGGGIHESSWLVLDNCVYCLEILIGTFHVVQYTQYILLCFCFLKTLYILQRTLSLSTILAIVFLGGLYGSFEDKKFVHFTWGHSDQPMGLHYQYTRFSKICTTKISLCNSTGYKLFDCKDSKYGDSFVRELISKA